jgi:16S rRNA (guanine527-N7)-methyltransferase
MASSAQWSSAALSERLQQGARQLELPIVGVQVGQLLAYLERLDRWNGVHSLSAWKSPSDLLVHHVFDSLSLVRPLQRLADGRPLRVLDAGSGPGFPAAVLAVMNPSWPVTAVDAVGKKIAFVRQAALESGIANLIGVHSRLEDMPPSKPFDVIVSRAFGTLGHFAAQTLHLLTAGGVWVAQKGRMPDEEIAGLTDDLRVFHVEPVTVPAAPKN